jgi:TPP-dependent trihydroxycyclohexane-1,2-dione (THcHDO) dehydratase
MGVVIVPTIAMGVIPNDASVGTMIGARLQDAMTVTATPLRCEGIAIGTMNVETMTVPAETSGTMIADIKLSFLIPPYVCRYTSAHAAHETLPDFSTDKKIVFLSLLAPFSLFLHLPQRHI